MITLKTTPRIPGGKLATARTQGLIPAVYYGGKATPVSIFIDRVEFQKVYKKAGVTSIITLEADKKVNTLVHEVSHDTMTGLPTHVDFMIVDMSHTTHATVPLTFIGEAPGIKTHGATLVKVLHEIEVEAMADKLPHSIEVDLSNLTEADSSITVGELILPKDVIIYHTKLEELVANLSVQKVIEEEEVQPVIDTEEKA